MRLGDTGAGFARGASDRTWGAGLAVATRPQRSLRVLVHDFAGHPFQIDLSRSLARRGHTVRHVYCGSYTSGKGRFDAGDDANLSVVAVPAGESFARYSPVRRLSQEAAYGRRFTRVAATFRPDVILACNVPLVAKSVVSAWRSSRRSSASKLLPMRRPSRPARFSASALMATLCRSCNQNTQGTPSRRHQAATTDLATSGTLQARMTSGRNVAATRVNRRP